MATVVMCDSEASSIPDVTKATQKTSDSYASSTPDVTNSAEAYSTKMFNSIMSTK